MDRSLQWRIESRVAMEAADVNLFTGFCEQAGIDYSVYGAKN